MALHFKKVYGEPSLTIRLKVYADFSLATDPFMTSQWYGVGDIGVLSATWERMGTEEKPRGWRLRLKHF